MAYWLLKTEPGAYSWDDLKRDRKTAWDGIKNPLALKHLRTACKGDKALVYHTGKERRAMGIARITKEHYPDPEKNDPKMSVVDIAIVKALKEPVTLEHIKSDPAFKGWDLLRLSRLSFVPVPAKMWQHLLKISGTQ